MSGAEGVDGSPKTLCNTLKNEEKRILIFKPLLRLLETQQTKKENSVFSYKNTAKVPKGIFKQKIIETRSDKMFFFFLKRN